MRHTVYEVKLKNGSKGLFIDIPDASVMTFEFNFRAGEYLVDKPKWETPHLMEHLLLGANELIPKARDFQAEFEKNGAYCNASTGTYDVIYEAECADFEWERIAGLMKAAIAQPLFLEDEFEAEFGNVREELVGRSNNHFRHLGLALRQASGFLALTDQARLELMSNVKLADIKRHYKKTHNTSNMRFVIGGILPSDRRSQLEELLESLPLPKGTERIELPREKPINLDHSLYIDNDTVQNMYFSIDTYIPRKLSTKELDALHMLSILLTETYYSRILGSAREQGLIYHIGSGSSQSRNALEWSIGGQVSQDNAIALFELISNELTTVKKGNIKAEEVEAAKQYALGRYQRSAQTVAGTTNGYSYRYFYDEVVEDYYKIPERIEKITKQDIVTITKELFAKKIWALGGLGSCGAEFLEQLRQNISYLW